MTIYFRGREFDLDNPPKTPSIDIEDWDIYRNSIVPEEIPFVAKNFKTKSTYNIYRDGHVKFCGNTDSDYFQSLISSRKIILLSASEILQDKFLMNVIEKLNINEKNIF